jgi:hypothetical protein
VRLCSLALQHASAFENVKRGTRQTQTRYTTLHSQAKTTRTHTRHARTRSTRCARHTLITCKTTTSNGGQRSNDDREHAPSIHHPTARCARSRT